MITFTLIVFLLKPPTYDRDVQEGFKNLTECRETGRKEVRANGGTDKALFTCIEVRRDRKR